MAACDMPNYCTGNRQPLQTSLEGHRSNLGRQKRRLAQPARIEMIELPEAYWLREVPVRVSSPFSPIEAEGQEAYVAHFLRPAAQKPCAWTGATRCQLALSRRVLRVIAVGFRFDPLCD